MYIWEYNKKKSSDRSPFPKVPLRKKKKKTVPVTPPTHRDHADLLGSCVNNDAMDIYTYTGTQPKRLTTLISHCAAVFASVCLSRARKCRKIVFKKLQKKKKSQNERIGYIRKREGGVETGEGTTAGTADLFQ